MHNSFIHDQIIKIYVIWHYLIIFPSKLLVLILILAIIAIRIIIIDHLFSHILDDKGRWNSYSVQIS